MARCGEFDAPDHQWPCEYWQYIASTESSVTTTFPHTSEMISFLGTRRPAFSASSRSTANDRGRSSTSSPVVLCAVHQRQGQSRAMAVSLVPGAYRKRHRPSGAPANLSGSIGEFSRNTAFLGRLSIRVRRDPKIANSPAATCPTRNTLQRLLDQSSHSENFIPRQDVSAVAQDFSCEAVQMFPRKERSECPDLDRVSMKRSRHEG